MQDDISFVFFISGETQVHLSVGDQLLVQFGPYGDRLTAVVVDSTPGQTLSIFLKLPPQILRHIQKDGSVAGQYVHESTLLGFRTTIRSCCTSPSCVLVLKWPEGIRNEDPRKEKRLDCSFPGTLTADGRPYSCMVENVSKSGVRIRLMQETNMRIMPLFGETSKLQLDFYALEERNAYSFRCTLLREYINRNSRHVVLLIGEQERAVRRILENYVSQVLGPVETVPGEH